MSSPFLPQPPDPAGRRAPLRKEHGAAMRHRRSVRSPIPPGLFLRHRIAASAAVGVRIGAVLSHCTEAAASPGGGRARATGSARSRTDAAAG